MDSSAYVKLVLEQGGHDVLRMELAEWDGYVSSALLGVEGVRACARYGDAYGHEARAWLEGVSLLALNDAVLDEAASLRPSGLRSLGALHLATALSISDEIGAFFCYDEQLADAAVAYGLNVVRPS